VLGLWPGSPAAAACRIEKSPLKCCAGADETGWRALACRSWGVFIAEKDRKGLFASKERAPWRWALIANGRQCTWAYLLFVWAGAVRQLNKKLRIRTLSHRQLAFKAHSFTHSPSNSYSKCRYIRQGAQTPCALESQKSHFNFRIIHNSSSVVFLNIRKGSRCLMSPSGFLVSLGN